MIASTTEEAPGTPATKKNVLIRVLALITPRVVTFEEFVPGLRENLSIAYAWEEDWKLAAGALSCIPLESSTRNVDTAYKLKIYVR